MKNKKISQNTKDDIDDDVVGFYELLFEVDRRINPHLYSNNKMNNEIKND